ncbi:Hypothetical_protein [Hexamita inflata]|uniref:Hypothetical_protein n=1 Tax=Hexamita inflata TaxID=28002 RepID=A0AA86Q0D7_9EUKA|nr:Hypothetical protein HINF_LOCUS35127 [Hexamita inflata]
MVTAFNTAEVQILQEYPISPAAPVEPTKAKEVEPPRSVLSKRKIFTVEFKKKVIDYYILLQSSVKSSPCSAITNTMRFFSVQDITEFNINNFMRKDNFAKIMKCSSDQQKKFKIKERKSDYPTIEAKLLEFFEASVCVCLNDLRIQAGVILNSLPPDSKERINFGGSNCYFHNFIFQNKLELQL